MVSRPRSNQTIPIFTIFDKSTTAFMPLSHHHLSRVTTATDYAGNYIYENGLLKFFSHPEGYVEPNGSGFSYVYQYKDHLGNVRLSYSDTNEDGIVDISEIVEESNYYPFGLKHKGYNNQVTSTNPALNYKFGGKEYQDELDLNWYDVSARNYDPALGRWMNIDPLAEKMRRHSPYNYAFNNPLVFIDPDGKAAFTVVGADKKAQENIKNQLPKESQNYVKFDDNGELDAKLINEGAKENPESLNLRMIAHLANSEDTYIYSTTNQYQAKNKNTGEVEQVNMNDSGESGATLPTDNTDVTAKLELTSVDENIHVIVSDSLSDKGQAKTTAHETVHAYLFDLAINHGSTETPWHNFEPAGIDEITGGPIFIYTSPPQIKLAEEEAVINYNANR